VVGSDDATTEGEECPAAPKNGGRGRCVCRALAPVVAPGTGRLEQPAPERQLPVGDERLEVFVKGEAGSSGGQIKLEVQPNGQASCMFRGSVGSRQLQAGPNVIDGHWHQVICQRIGDQIVETVDGETHSLTKATGSITVTAQVRLGSHENGGDWYRGVLDEVTYSIG
jgi:hypothetical protein